MSAGSSLYLPLPQSNTDSESEEELQSGQENLIKSRAKPRLDIRIDATLNKVNYKPLNDEREEGTSQSNFIPSPTAAKPLASSLHTLSVARKALFIFSIFVCIMTIVGFLWILPCDLNPCSSDPPARSKSWETPILDYELHGPIAVVARNVGPGGNVVLLARRATNAPQPLRNEMICLLGESGEVGWRHMLTREPYDLDCSLIDVNKDAVLDCIVAGSEDLLKAVDPLSGVTVWEVAATRNDSRPAQTQFPLLLPDLNADDVPELLTSRSYRGPQPFSQILIVCGASGKVIGEPVPSTLCSGISGLVLEKDLSISYTCLDINSKKSEQTILLSQLIVQAGKAVPTSVTAGELLDLPRSHDAAPGLGLEAHVAGRRLLMENQGRCPNDCRVVVVVKDKNNHTLFDKSLESVYGMAPASLSFKNLNGFVLKFWQWNGRKGKRTSNSTDSSTQVPTQNTYLRTRRRSVAELWVEVNERVSLITFNDTDIHLLNVSQQTIIQLCRGSNCQPSASASRQSLLIADLDGDRSKELVSYTSGYVGDGGKTTPRRLESKVRVVRLEEELPLLFEAINQL